MSYPVSQFKASDVVLSTINLNGALGEIYFHSDILIFGCREGETVRVLDEKEQQKEARWNSLDTSSKIGDWAARHQYSLILGGWASSLGVAAAIISRDK